MPPLSQAHLQQNYRPILAGFTALVVVTLLATVLLTSSAATITVTPKLIPLDTTFSLVVGPTADPSTGLTGTVATSTVAATVTANPSGQATAVPAHASGDIIIHNTTRANQPLSAGTRLQSSTGVIVRTANRVDVPAGGTVSVKVTADPTGPDGNLAPGRLIIVALRAANQQLIYGEVVTALTGGTVQAAGTLALDDLTKASDAAQAKIRQQVGNDQPGHLRLLSPQSVATDPQATTPSPSYTVTVTMKLIEVTYAAVDFDQRVQSELATGLADDQRLVKVDAPIISAGDQPDATSITLSIKAQGSASLASSSASLQPQNFVGLDRSSIEKKLLGLSTVKAVTVRFSPFWRTVAPDQARRITVRLLTPAAP